MATTGRGSMSTLTLACLAALSLLALQHRGAEAFIRIMGGSDAYCGYQGSSCYYDGDCCYGHICRYGYKRFGGACQREIPSSQPAALAAPSLSNLLECQSDSGCPAGQCCVDVPLGMRGASIRACRAQCPDKEMEALLDDYYSRYYRSHYYYRRRRRSAAGRQGE